MAKKKSWFFVVKKLFGLETWSKPEKKDKRRRWVLGKLKIKRLATIAPPSPSKERTLSEAEEEQNKHALTVAVATAAAAEAAVAAAHVAAEVVRLTGTPQCSVQSEEENQEFSAIEDQYKACLSAYQCERKIQELASVKIQTVFRGYLARKALRALKGLVKLQAIIRGRAVRRQAITTLKCLQSIVNIQSQVCAKRYELAEQTCHCNENKQSEELRDKVIKIESNSHRRWDDSLLTREEANASLLSRQEAVIKRERIKEYSLSHRKMTDSEQNKVNGRWRYWLEQWVDTQVAKRGELEDLDSVCSSNLRPSDEYREQLRNFRRPYHLEGLVSPISVPRRSFHHKKQYSIGDENSLLSSPVVPTYMAATESAKAKVRSMSSPKLRPGSLDTCSDSNSPHKNKLSLISPITSEVTCSGTISKPGPQQRSPSLKGLPGPIKSSRTLKYLSLDSDCPLLNWDQHSTFR